MSPGGLQRFDVPGVLAKVESVSPLDAVDVLAKEFARSWHASSVSFLIADYGGDHLARLVHATSGTSDPTGTPTPSSTHRSADAAPVIPIDGTWQGQVLRTQQSLLVPGGGGVWVFAPVTSRGEAIGVLEALLPDAPAADQARGDIAAAAHLLAYVVVTNRRYTDLFEWGQRGVLFDLAAEMQRRLLPASFTCEAGHCTIAGWLEPARSAAGDTFDYILGRDQVHASLTDAMGHAVPAALLATLAVAALRQSRRRGDTLAEQADYANQSLNELAGPDEFVTGLLLRADLVTGTASLINAGHPRPYLMRDGVVELLPIEADLPFGIFPRTSYQVHQLQLRPGDRLLMVTDGMLERNAAGLDLPKELINTRDLHPRETVQQLIRQVASHGDLMDDATVLCLDWNTHDTHRDADTGADPAHASSAI